MKVPEVTCDEAAAALERGDTTFVDVRDPRSYAQAHIPGAQHVQDSNIAQFVAEADKAKPVIVYCYHGNSSKGGTMYLLEQGFETVHSMAGGFEKWRGQHPSEASEG